LHSKNLIRSRSKKYNPNTAHNGNLRSLVSINSGLSLSHFHFLSSQL